MKINKLFTSNKSQAVRIPKSLAFNSSIKEVVITRHENGLLITPRENVWDDFFNQPPCPDFMADGREQPEIQERESF